MTSPATAIMIRSMVEFILLDILATSDFMGAYALFRYFILSLST
jgi:hypothetical protein